MKKKKKSSDEFGSIGKMFSDSDFGSVSSMGNDDPWAKHTIKRKKKRDPSDDPISRPGNKSPRAKRHSEKKKKDEPFATSLMFSNMSGTSDPIPRDPSKKKKAKSRVGMTSTGSKSKRRSSKKDRDSFGAVNFGDDGEDDLWANNANKVINRKPKSASGTSSTASSRHSRKSNLLAGAAEPFETLKIHLDAFMEEERNVGRVDFSNLDVAAPPESDEEDDFAGMGRVAFSDPEPIPIKKKNTDDDDETALKSKNRKRLPDFMMTNAFESYEPVSAERNQSRQARFAHQEREVIPEVVDKRLTSQSDTVISSKSSLSSDGGNSSVSVKKKKKKRSFLSLW